MMNTGTDFIITILNCIQISRMALMNTRMSETLKMLTNQVVDLFESNSTQIRSIELISIIAIMQIVRHFALLLLFLIKSLKTMKIDRKQYARSVKNVVKDGGSLVRLLLG